MSLKTLKIEIPKGYEIDNFDISSGVVSFKETPKDIKELINNFSDVLKYHGIEESDFYELCEGLEDDEIAYRQLKLIVSAYNLKEVPDYNNSSQTKYEPYFKLSSSGSGFSYLDYGLWAAISTVGSRLAFLDKNNMRDAVEKFLNIYQTFYTSKA